MGPHYAWRSDPITEKQRKMIAFIENVAQAYHKSSIPRFTGRNKGAACDYISRYSGVIDYLTAGKSNKSRMFKAPIKPAKQEPVYNYTKEEIEGIFNGN